MTEHWVVISVIVFQTFINLYYVIILCSIKSTIIKDKKKPIYDYTTKVCTNK